MKSQMKWRMSFFDGQNAQTGISQVYQGGRLIAFVKWLKQTWFQIRYNEI